MLVACCMHNINNKLNPKLQVQLKLNQEYVLNNLGVVKNKFKNFQFFLFYFSLFSGMYAFDHYTASDRFEGFFGLQHFKVIFLILFHKQEEEPVNIINLDFIKNYRQQSDERNRRLCCLELGSLTMCIQLELAKQLLHYFTVLQMISRANRAKNCLQFIVNN